MDINDAGVTSTCHVLVTLLTCCGCGRILGMQTTHVVCLPSVPDLVQGCAIEAQGEACTIVGNILQRTEDHVNNQFRYFNKFSLP